MPKDPSGDEKKKPRPKDVFGRALPTEEEFEVLKNAPRYVSGFPLRGVVLWYESQHTIDIMH